MSTMYTLDGVSFVYSIKGEKEETFDYNLADINIDSSYAELYKWTGENKHTDADTQSGTLCETYPMSRVREQGFTVSSDISENNGTGWYYIKIVVTTTDGSQLVTYYNDIYIDRYMYNIDFGDYYKNYTKTLEYKGEEQTVNYNIAELIYDDSEIDLNAYFSQTGDYTIGMGIAEAPDGYSVEQWMTFLGPVLQSDNGIKRSVRFRIYNVFDENYKTNAVWHTVDNEQEEKLYTYNIKEAELVDGNYVFDESSYCSGGAYYIPLMNGINEICCEVENMNGQTTTQTFYINATKEIIPAEGETTTTETEVEYELDADVLDSHSYIKMLCHDFYTGDGYNFAIQGTGGYGYICYESGIYEFVLYYGNYNISNRKDYNDNLSVGTIDATGVDGMQPIVENVSYEQDGMNFCYSFTVSDNNALDLDNLVNLTYNGEYNYKLLNANGSYTDTSEDAEEEVPTEEPATEEPPTEEPVAEALAAPVSYAEPYDYDPSDTGVNYPTAELNYKVQFGEIDEETGIGTWTDYSIANCGIYKTQISKNDDNSANVSIWGTYMYQDDVEDGGYCYGYVNFNILDAKGNVGIQKKEYELDGEQKYDYRNTQVIYSYENKKPSLEIKGSYEEDSENVEFGNIYNYDDTICFDSEGNIVAECDVPLNRVLSYGAYTNVVAISENITDDSENPSDNDDYYYDEKFSQYKYHFLSSVPMIKNTGYYEMEFMDIFGNTYQQTLDATKAFEEGSDNIVINYSEKDITNQNVTVMANLEAVSGQAVDTEAEITTIFAVYADEAGSRVSGEMDLFSSGAASIVLEDNATVTVEGYYKGTKVSKTVKVNNIDKQIEEVKIEYLYGEGVTEPNFIDGSTDTVDGSVKAILYCDEELYGINGDTKYVFPVGSKKGDKYTFEYKDEAGNTGSAVAVLEYNIDKTVPPEPDTTAPEFEGTISGLRYNYTLLDSIFDVDEDGNTSESSRINDVISDYTARAYKMEFNVTDESKVKLIVRKSGEEAPTSYNDTSDSIDGLKVSGYTIEITKAASFDLYFADTEGNVKAITGFNINSIDNEAANVEIKYKSLRNDDGTAFIRAYIVADEAEEVVVINSDARTFMNEETVTEIGQEVTKLVKRYYHDFSENDVYVFKYTDVYGNSAVTKAEVKGVDFAPPSLLSTNWYGTKRVTGKDSNSIVVNEAPDTVGLSNVNNNITATLSYNKPISGVKLYEYDETQENGLGKEITGDSVVVTAACLNKNVTVTYENNFGKVVVETQAKSSGKKSYNTLLAVGCIDKELPVISVSEGTVSKNKQKVTYTITTDKETYLNGETEKSVEHIYVAERNGEHKIKVMDAAGNVSSCTITVTEIDNEILEMQFGSSADNMTSNIENLKINAGDKLYVKPSKAATVTLGSVSVTLNAGETGELQLQSDAGMYLLHAVDSSTGKEYSYKVLMVYKDRSAPAISFDSTIVRLPAGTDRATIEAALKNGITVEDNVDGIIDSSNVLIEIPEKLDAGIHIITYTVSDKAGNEATATRSLYLYEEGTPNLIINGNEAIPYGTMVVTDSSITVQGTNLDKGSVLIKYRYGIKTAAQMKYGTTGVLLNGALKDKQQTFDLPKTSGFYTIYIRTQNRKEQITYVYVDLSE